MCGRLFFNTIEKGFCGFFEDIDFSFMLLFFMEAKN